MGSHWRFITYNRKPWADRDRLTHGCMNHVIEKLRYVQFTDRG